MFLGAKGTGKSNIRTRFCRGTFTEYSNSTVGIQLSNRKFWGPFRGKQEVFNMVLWDICPGAEETLLSSYLKNAVAVIYVYDMTKKETLE